MFNRNLVAVWTAIILMSSMFLLGQEQWGPDDPSIALIDPPEAQHGQEVTIYGTYFGSAQGASVVTFSGVDAGQANSWTDQRIEITVPADISSGPVVVTVDGRPSIATMFGVIEAQADIGPEGGNVEVSDSGSEIYRTKIVVPAGALDEPVTISIKKSPNSPLLPEGLEYVSPIIECKPDDVQFNELVEITIPYDGQQVEDLAGAFAVSYSNQEDSWNLVLPFEMEEQQETIRLVDESFSLKSVVKLNLSLVPESISTSFSELNTFPIENPVIGDLDGVCLGMSVFSGWYDRIIYSPYLSEAYEKPVIKNLAYCANTKATDGIGNFLSRFSQLYLSLGGYFDKYTADITFVSLLLGSPLVFAMTDNEWQFDWPPLSVNSGHAVLVYGWQRPDFLIYDPNYMESKAIVYDEQLFSFDTYTSGGFGYDSLYPYVKYHNKGMRTVYENYQCPGNTGPGKPTNLHTTPQSPIDPGANITFYWDCVNDPDGSDPNEDGSSEVSYCLEIKNKAVPSEVYFNNCEYAGFPGSDEDFVVPSGSVCGMLLNHTLYPLPYGTEIDWAVWAADECGAFSEVLPADWATFSTEECADADGDSHMDQACGGDDCNDDNEHVFPGAPELCDSVDNQCPGDPEGYGDIDEGCIKIVFITGSWPDGAMGGLSGADTICQTTADSAGLSGTFKAWLSDGTASVASRFIHSAARYELVDGTLIADGWGDLTDGSIGAGIDVTAHGSQVLNSRNVWTSTNVYGNYYAAHGSCSNWSMDGSYFRAGVGINKSTDQSWTLHQSLPCDLNLPLYCFEQ